MEGNDSLAVRQFESPYVCGAGLLKHAVVENCSVLQVYLAKAGLMCDRHLHSYHHILLVAHGAIRLSVDGTVRDIEAPAIVKVTAGHIHDFTALQDGTICYCIVPDVSKLTKEQRKEAADSELLVGVIESVPKRPIG